MPSGDALILDGIFYDVRGLPILQGVYFRLNPGRVCGVFGRNGSGKSTLLKIAAAQIHPTCGHVIINGVLFLKPRRRARFALLSYLPQESMLPKTFRVRHILESAPQLRISYQDPILAAVRDTQISQLSGGERRYLELQIVLSLRRPYLLLDEPFSGVAPQLVEKMCLAIRAAADQGCGIAISGHAYQELLPLLDDACILRQKQCRPLEASSDFSEELRSYGYLPAQTLVNSPQKQG